MKYILVFLAVLLVGCAGTPNEEPPKQLLEDPTAVLSAGYEQLALQRPADAMGHFDQVIDHCDFLYKQEARQIYAARSQEEMLAYLMLAAKKGEDAITVASICADARYLKGYASLEVGHLDAAELYVISALDMSPNNARYLSELGHIYHVKKEWQRALEIFQKAEESASFSPEEVRSLELARAKRGVGFSLIELGQLDLAEQKFRECLILNPKDQSALSELKYIGELRQSF